MFDTFPFVSCSELLLFFLLADDSLVGGNGDAPHGVKKALVFVQHIISRVDRGTRVVDAFFIFCGLLSIYGVKQYQF